jgi:hypothetical protein
MGGAGGGGRNGAPAGLERVRLPPDMVGAAPPGGGASSGDVVGAVPDNAPAGCPGVEAAGAGKVDSCAGCPNQAACASGEAAAAGPDPDIAAIAARLGAPVKHKILVLRCVRLHSDLRALFGLGVDRSLGLCPASSLFSAAAGKVRRPCSHVAPASTLCAHSPLT